MSLPIEEYYSAISIPYSSFDQSIISWLEYSILKFRSKHNILTLGFFGIFRCIRTVCNLFLLINTINTRQNSLFFFFLFSWPKLFKIVSIIVLCKRAWWPIVSYLLFGFGENLYFCDRNANWSLIYKNKQSPSKFI